MEKPKRSPREIGLEERAHQAVDWTIKGASRHLRARVAVISSQLHVTRAAALEFCVQAAEAIMNEHAAALYGIALRRRLCSPEGTDSRTRLQVGDLPPLPPLSTPLGLGMSRQESPLFEVRAPVTSPFHPAYRIIQENERKELLPALGEDAPATPSRKPPSATRSRKPPSGTQIGDHPAWKLIEQRKKDIWMEQRAKKRQLANEDATDPDAMEDG